MGAPVKMKVKSISMEKDHARGQLRVFMNDRNTQSLIIPMLKGRSFYGDSNAIYKWRLRADEEKLEWRVVNV